MRTLISLVAIAGVLIYGRFTTASPASNVNLTNSSNEEGTVQTQEQVAPAYAKWGKIAMEKVMSKYPTADVIDYLHIGREVGATSSIEKFKLWLRGADNNEFGVFINIEFDNQTEEIIDVTYTETLK